MNENAILVRNLQSTVCNFSHCFLCEPLFTCCMLLLGLVCRFLCTGTCVQNRIQPYTVCEQALCVARKKEGKGEEEPASTALNFEYM